MARITSTYTSKEPCPECGGSVLVSEYETYGTTLNNAGDDVDVIYYHTQYCCTECSFMEDI